MGHVPISVCRHSSRESEQETIEGVEQALADLIERLRVLRERLREIHEQIDHYRIKPTDLTYWNLELVECRAKEGDALQGIKDQFEIMSTQFKAACKKLGVLESKSSKRIEAVEDAAKDLMWKWQDLTKKVWQLEDEAKGAEQD
ncbi:hypothetical protein LTR53_008335 [Teratosphaeriaceae sp. CCFEE 6253]|nr:hypothetical protein LTR53_008335 [Teratosphaeriaceae sp. CCFEE 6253]